MEVQFNDFTRWLHVNVVFTADSTKIYEFSFNTTMILKETSTDWHPEAIGSRPKCTSIVVTSLNAQREIVHRLVTGLKIPSNVSRKDRQNTWTQREIIHNTPFDRGRNRIYLKCGLTLNLKTQIMANSKHWNWLFSRVRYIRGESLERILKDQYKERSRHIFRPPISQNKA